jgi:hypothetical protein
MFVSKVCVLRREADRNILKVLRLILDVILRDKLRLYENVCKQKVGKTKLNCEEHVERMRH